MKFVAFDPRNHRNHTGRSAGPPAITVRKSGQVALTRSAIRLLLGRETKPGERFHVRFLTSPDEPDIFGLEILEESSPEAYSLRCTKTGAPGHIATRTFIRFARLDTTSTKRHPCKLIEPNGKRVLIANRTEFKTVSKGE